jgi:uncharacterized membrane protein
MSGWLEAFGKSHPATAHFPIALLIASLIAEIIFRITRRLALRTTGIFCLLFGTLGAIVTTLNGFPLTKMVYFDSRPDLLVRHQTLGLIATVTAIAASVMSLFLRDRSTGWLNWFYSAMLIFLSVMIFLAGIDGSKLIFGG